MRRSKIKLSIAASVSLLIASAPEALADHQWSTYHWDRDGVPNVELSV